MTLDDPLFYDDDRPVHQPAAPEAPIPGRHWYAGCDPDGPRVSQAGICEGCGEFACPVCGREGCPDHPAVVSRYGGACFASRRVPS